MNTINKEIYGWNAKVEIAEHVVPILKKYREIISSENSYSIPTWVDEENANLTEDELKNIWISYVDAIIYAFSLELSGNVLTEMDRNDQINGLKLFARFYKHLWD